MINTLSNDVAGNTRDRLLAAGFDLFSRQGFDRTTVGEIERLAGLQPRRGALYHYFPSKMALLIAAVERHVEDVAQLRRRLEDFSAPDMLSSAIAIGRMVLDGLDDQQHLIQLCERCYLVPNLRDMVHRQIAESTHIAAEEVLRSWLGPAADQFDLKSLALVLVGPLMHFKRTLWTFGATPFGLDEDEFLEGWAKMSVVLIEGIWPETR